MIKLGRVSKETRGVIKPLFVEDRDLQDPGGNWPAD